MVSPKLTKFVDNRSHRVAFGRFETGAARGAVATPGGGAKNMGMLLDAVVMLLDAMLWLAVALSTAAGVLAVVAINAERKQKLLMRRVLDAALREGGQVKDVSSSRPGAGR